MSKETKLRNDARLQGLRRDALLAELRKYLGEENAEAERLLESTKYDMLAAMELSASEHGVMELSDSDWETCLSSDGVDVSHAMYASSYGRVVKVMERIETLAMAATVQLPQIVVIGSESSGKSSTLERIAGFSLFPRDTKICTRMPIMLRLINIGSAPLPEATCEEATVILKFPGRNDVSVSEADAADAVGALMASVVPPGRGVIYEQLTIEVRKASVPTLDLIDLPGIVAASIEGEPADMMSRTRDITERYLRGANTIVVAVVPANITRVRDSQAIQLVQANAKQDVTLGVLAKSDLAHDPRFKQHKKSSPYWELEQRLAGDADDMIPLKNGWVAVKNRDTEIEEEEATGLMESSQAERKWFLTETSISAEMQKEQCGIDALLRNINRLFTKHMRTTWAPRAVKHLEQEMNAAASQLSSLGPLPATLSLQKVLSDFTHKFNEPHVSALLPLSISKLLTTLVSKAARSVKQPAGEQQTVNLLQLVAKDATKAAIIEAVTSSAFLHPCNFNHIRAAVMCAFEQPGSLHLKRFSVLRTVVEEVSSALMNEQKQSFSSAMQTAVEEHFLAFCGSPYDRNDRCNPHGSQWQPSMGTYHIYGYPSVGDSSSRTSSESLLVHRLTEVAMRSLVLPLQLHSPKLFETLGESLLKSKVAASIFSGKKPPCLKHPDTAAKLLAESCKEERAKLAKRRYDLYRSLKEVQKL